ncbi:type IV pilin [Candidatus Bathyarchaeota archaeon]|nr:type IV pilin [Candidatus Bathyarchaeota archaeon]
MNKSFRRNRRAVSPVIATIIIVAVAIVMSIAVAYWMLGLAGTFTRYEKLEFTSAYAKTGTGGTFNVTFSLKNTGSATATVNHIFINGIPLEDVDAFDDTNANFQLGSADNYSALLSDGVSIAPGREVKGFIILNSGGSIGSGQVTSGITIELKITTAAGNEYPKSIALP